jgi:hypothetical protein
LNKILVISTTDLGKDPRPHRQIKYLTQKYEVHSAGSKPSGLETKYFPLSRANILIKILAIILLKLGFYKLYFKLDFRINVNELMKYDYEYIILHHIRLAPLVLSFSKNAQLILDAHEYYPENYSDNFVWRVLYKKPFEWLCYEYLPKVKHIITVGDSIAELYRENYSASVSVVKSIPDFVDISPTRRKDGKIQIAHHGLASPTRKSELLVDTIKLLDPDVYELHFYLVYDSITLPYFNILKKKAFGMENVYFHEPVPFNELIRTINKHDINIIFWPPVNRNLELALPNKFFEGIQARLMIVTGPSVEMMKEIDKNNLGLYSKDFKVVSLVELLGKLTEEQIWSYKQNVDRSSKEYSGEVETKKILSLLADLKEN